jgi:TFIIF-interacting CTD phosphatase-like protein
MDFIMLGDKYLSRFSIYNKCMENKSNKPSIPLFLILHLSNSLASNTKESVTNCEIPFIFLKHPMMKMEN